VGPLSKILTDRQGDETFLGSNGIEWVFSERIDELFHLCHHIQVMGIDAVALPNLEDLR
jgi:hypothetical protein